MIDKIILDILNDDYYTPLNYHELANKVVEKDSSLDIDIVYKTIVELENDYQIIRVKKDKLQSISRLNLVVGDLEIKRRGFGFVKTEDFDVFVAKDDLNGAINKDKVLVKLKSKSNRDSKEGVVFQVLKHGYDLIVGSVVIRKGNVFVIPDDPALDFWIRIDRKSTLNASEGHKVLCYLNEINKEQDLIFGTIKEIIGHVNDVGMDVLSIVYQHGFNPDFSKEAIKEATIIDQDSIVVGNRTDLRDMLTITIDGADAKDLDDAICLEVNEKGNIVLYVSIADVSYYVVEKSAMDQEAYQRSTSVYLTDRVVPMIPHQLSNNICSLLPDVDRLTQTCKMEFDSNGDIISYDIFESIINSKYRMTYDDVNLIIENDRDTITKYQPIVSMINKMLELSHLLRSKKQKRGMLDFNVPEPKIIVDKKGKPIEIVLRERKEAEKLIEDFMIIANETVAQHIYWMELPFIYRVHQSPDPKKIKDFLSYASVYNLKLKGSLDNLTSKDIQKLLNDINKNTDVVFMDRLLLRSMAKANYQRECIGHFGLASKYYTHFTSPIRRYPDLIVHRLLRKYLYDGSSLNSQDYHKLQKRLDKISEQTSKKERDAIEAERDVNDLKMAEYMSNKIGVKYTGVISGITNFGFFVELDNTVEGLVHISMLNDDHYIYNDKFHMLVGTRTSKQYRLGQKVKVVVDGVNVKSRSIDFRVGK